MKNFLFAFAVFLFYSVFGMWYYSCIVKGLCENDTLTNTPVQVETTTINTEIEKEIPTFDNLSDDGFVVRDENGSPLFSFPENLQINNKEGSVLIPESTDEFKNAIFKYLNDHQDMELMITGLRNDNESDTIGLGRANEIKAILEDFGVNADKLSVNEVKRTFDFKPDGTFNGGINFTLKKLSESRLSEIESGIVNKTLYSRFASKQFKADNTLQAYALELKNYLNKYPNKKATITGHTDNIGNNIANDWFGMERAKNVRRYLVSQGISSAKLTALSKGEKEPIDTNRTSKGRRKNRRIEIKVN